MTFKFKREQQGLIEIDPTTGLLQSLRDDLKFYKTEQVRLMKLAEKDPTNKDTAKKLNENLEKINNTLALIAEIDEE